MAKDRPLSARPGPGALDDEDPGQTVPALDRLASLVAKLLRVPVALVSLVDAERQEFLGIYGLLPETLNRRQAPILYSFSETVVATGQPVVIQDARHDERVARDPASRDLDFTAYLGMPLVNADGRVVGSLCAIDAGPRVWTQEEQAILRELVGFALTELEAHRIAQRLRQAEQSLATTTHEISEQRRLALDSAQMGWWQLDLASGQVRCDERFRTILGTHDAVVSFDWILSILHPDDRAGIDAAVQAAARSVDPVPYQAEFRVVRADGVVRWVFAKGRANRDGAGHSDGPPLSFDGTLVDITERKRVEAELAFGRHQLELIFRESPAALALWRGEDLVFEQVNPEYQDLFRGRQLVGLPLLQACPELVGQGFDQHLRRVLLTGEAYTGHEVRARIQRDEGGPTEDRYFDFTYLQVRDAEDRPWGVYDHSVDVTERVLTRLAVAQTQRDLQQALADRQDLLEAEQNARSEAERIGRIKDEFLATLSHELRTPLNAILGWTQVLRGDPANTEDMEAGLATIERNSRAQNQIIEDLLDMSKIISGKVRLDVQQLDLAAVVGAALETMRPAATAKGIRLQPVIDPQARFVTGDPNRLQQVFWNLLTNALKFTPKNGRVQVALKRIHSHLEVDVIDSGEGIAEEFLPHVFDRFRQQDASTTRRHGGLGLGLAIVKQLVELHGGSVHVESAGLGQGTTFRVMLPLLAVLSADDFPDPARQHPQGAASAPSLAVDTLDLGGIKVLVVDDELDARTLVKRLLEDRGAVVRTVASVTEALEAVQVQLPDVLISDIGMPEQDGYALIRQVRALPPEQGGRLPALALTAYARSEDRMKAILAGFQNHLAKPVEAAELLVLVANLAGRT